MPKGFNHISYATRDIEGTIDFYTRILGFKVMRYDLIEFDEGSGGVMKHAFIDVGHNQHIAFMDMSDVPTVEGPTDTGINAGLGVPRVVYHVAFDAPSERWLEDMRQHLAAHDVPVSGIIDHEWCKSISLVDPINGLELEYCTNVRDLTPEEAEPVQRFSAKREQLDQRVETSRLTYY